MLSIEFIRRSRYAAKSRLATDGEHWAVRHQSDGGRTMAAEPSMQRRVSDRRLYIWAAVFIPLIVLAGFARSYYLKGLFGTPALPGLLVHLHGLVMPAWVALFVAQVWLVAARRTKTHQRLGVLGATLAALLVLVGVATAIAGAARGSSPGPPPLQFLVV